MVDWIPTYHKAMCVRVWVGPTCLRIFLLISVPPPHMPIHKCILAEYKWLMLHFPDHATPRVSAHCSFGHAAWQTTVSIVLSCINRRTGQVLLGGRNELTNTNCHAATSGCKYMCYRHSIMYYTEHNRCLSNILTATCITSTTNHCDTLFVDSLLMNIWTGRRIHLLLQYRGQSAHRIG